MRVLSLFAGMGGFDLGLEMAGFEVVAQVEIDGYCRQILEHHFPNAKRYGDIKGVTGEQITRDCGAIELICGGFPCQDISTAGKGAGLDAERSGLWWEMRRLINELRPSWVIIENVAALRARGLDRVIASLEEMGYKTTCLGISASSVGAPHQRKRIWILGYAEKQRQGKSNNKAYTLAISGQARTLSSSSSLDVSNAHSDGCKLSPVSKKQGQSISKSDGEGGGDAAMANTDSDGIREQSGWRQWTRGATYSPFAFPSGPGQQQYDWEEPRTIESAMGVTAHGIPRKLALRAIGNAVVPAIPYAIARTIQRVERALASKSF